MSLTKGDPRGPTLRTQRLRLAWILAPLFLLLSKPSSQLLLAGILVSLPGLLLRGVAAGSIHKDRELATGGPFGHLRHPLFLGSLFLGLGLSIAGGRWWFPLIFLGLFTWVYGRTVVAEEQWLELRFGEEYRAYRETVPPFLPRVRRPPALPPSAGFRLWLYWRNKEWQAALGVALAFGLLWLRMAWLG